VAQKNNIPLYEQTNVNLLDFIETLKGLSPDIIAVVNFEQILKQQIIEIPNKSCINTHASLLPAYRGRAPLNWAIIN
jgi:methionyl-tRNA formyltransferase